MEAYFCNECETYVSEENGFEHASSRCPGCKRDELAAEVARLTKERDALVGDLGRLYSYLEDVKTVDYSIARAELLAILDSALCAVAAAKDGGDDDNH